MYTKLSRGKRHVTGDWSKPAFIIFALALFGIAYMAGTGYTQWDWRIEVHENGHLRAYAEDGVHAYRSGKYEVTSTYHTVRGLEGGYKAELDNIYAWTFWIGIAVPILGLITGWPFWGSALGFLLSMYVQLEREIYTFSSDLQALNRLTGVHVEQIAHRMTAGVWGMLLLMICAYAIYLLLILPPEERPKRVEEVPAHRAALRPIADHTSLRSFGTSGLLTREEDVGPRVPRVTTHTNGEENEPQGRGG